MTYDPGFEGYLREMFECMEGVHFRKMFGGVGIFRNGLMFALITSKGEFCLKADAETVSDFEAEGAREWMPQQSGRKPVSMGYWHAPGHLLEDPDAFGQWVHEAFDSARRIDAAKPLSKRKYKDE